MRKTAALPDDVEALRGIVLERSRALEVALCISQKLELEKLRFQIAVLKRERYCRSSEQLDQQLVQMQLSIEDLATSLAHVSAKLNGHDAYRYLKDVLERLPTHPASRVEELLPHCWRPTHQALA